MRIIISKSVRVVPLNFSKKILGDGFLASLGLPWASATPGGGLKFGCVVLKQHPLTEKHAYISHYEIRFHNAEAPMWCMMLRCNIATHQCGASCCGAIPMHQCGAWWCGAVCQCTNVVHHVAVRCGNMRVRGSGSMFKQSVVFLRHFATLRTRKHSTNMTIQ